MLVVFTAQVDTVQRAGGSSRINISIGIGLSFSSKFSRLVCSCSSVNLHSVTPILFCTNVRPFLVNKLEPQYLLDGRRKVYELLSLKNSFTSLLLNRTIFIF
ncbi:hypothetical protein BRADI_1g43992v3 [Brachypodium distachyon]|uniref:Uncharacterized protein n=1 Tax=Brachypodium distachyon TaxID=15368 RepID=A0A2K2DP95_BRADI|nr:hypothetical protein BRADI_1g43992v3 [Brachypodium distachyon]